jgi:tRNA U34 5-methylaminomethyl-2-thiouridine-forming methyltransferase MnmC
MTVVTNKMKLIETKDGSFTAFNAKYDETYHSISGAEEEAFEKHVKALGLEDEMRILDFCFGLGYNSLAATTMASDLEITALENDIEIIREMKNINLPEKLGTKFKTFSRLAEQTETTDSDGNTINLIIGDATKKIKELPENYFDRVYFDPFSPKKQPEMWTEEVFRDVFFVMKNGGKLSTYSCAKSVRTNMTAAGFQIKDGPSVGRKSPATIAEKRK